MAAPKRLTNEAKELIKTMTIEGRTQEEIGETLGIHGSTVGYYQKKFNLKPSNRWHFGEGMERLPELEEKQEPVNKKTKSWVQLVQQKIQLKGNHTNFDYEMEYKGTSLVIKPGYSESLEIDIKDLVAFGNEILDVAETVCQMNMV